MRYYRKCSELSIYSFHKILETGDFRYLVWDWDEYADVKLSGAEEVIWNELYQEYCKLTNDNRSLEYYKLKSRITYLETRLFVCMELFKQMLLRPMDKETFLKHIEEIRNWGFSYKKDYYDMDAMEKLDREIRFTQNGIDLKKDTLKSFEVTEDPVPLSKQVVMAEEALDKNTLDPKKISVEKWVYYMQRIKEKVTQRKKQLANRGRK